MAAPAEKISRKSPGKSEPGYKPFICLMAHNQLVNVMLPIRRHQPKEVSGEVVSSRKEAATSRS
jgi:hypothetical protein